VAELQSGAPLPAKVLTANAYLGAAPIRAALDAGAQIVITGRCVDSAVTLGVLMHEFGWQAGDFDRLAGGSLAGHIIECGCQGTGGLHTDWQDVPDWAHIGYPIVECAADGSFIVTKPAGTGGLVAPPCVAEQMLYEIHDPAAYLLPDVVCDFTQVAHAADRPRARARERRARPRADGFVQGQRHLPGRLQDLGAADHRRLRRRRQGAAHGRGHPAARGRAAGRARAAPFSATHLEVLGAESCYGPLAQPEVAQTREAILRLAARHRDKAALELLAREIAPPAPRSRPAPPAPAGAPRSRR
jgi:hypothetical protein